MLKGVEQDECIVSKKNFIQPKKILFVSEWGKRKCHVIPEYQKCTVQPDVHKHNFSCATPPTLTLLSSWPWNTKNVQAEIPGQKMYNVTVLWPVNFAPAWKQSPKKDNGIPTSYEFSGNKITDLDVVCNSDYGFIVMFAMLLISAIF